MNQVMFYSFVDINDCPGVMDRLQLNRGKGREGTFSTGNVNINYTRNI